MQQAFPLFPNESHTTRPLLLNAVGERRLITLLREWLGPVAPASPFGMGDDCAVLAPPRPARYQLLTTDSLTYGHHFNEGATPQEAGAKLIKRNLSDVAAMGGRPGSALLNLLCGPDLSIAWLEQFVVGMRQSCEQHGVSIVGGDISALGAGEFTASLTLVGQVEGRPALRSTAEVGNTIYVTGRLGGSILAKHLHFEPRMQEGQWLAAEKACRAMMDLTDGLGKDLDALLPEGSSAAIERDRLPISADARKCAELDGRSPEEHAFCDGEDYELLFTVANETDPEAFELEWQAEFPELELTRIGRIVEAHPAGRYIDASNGQSLAWQAGFEHFKRV